MHGKTGILNFISLYWTEQNAQPGDSGTGPNVNAVAMSTLKESYPRLLTNCGFIQWML